MQTHKLLTCVSVVIDVYVYGIIGISKIDFFNFSSTVRLEQNQKLLKIFLKAPKLVR